MCRESCNFTGSSLQHLIEVGNTWPRAIAMLKVDARCVAAFEALLAQLPAKASTSQTA